MKLRSFIKKYAVTLWMIAAAVMLGGFIAYAAYSSVDKAKRVVSTRSGLQLFSSNFLWDINTSNVRKVTGSQASVYIYNCAKGNRNNYSKDKDIDYNIIVSLIDPEGNVVQLRDGETLPAGFYIEFCSFSDGYERETKTPYYFTADTLVFNKDNTNGQLRCKLERGELNYNKLMIHFPDDKDDAMLYNIKVDAIPDKTEELKDFGQLSAVFTKADISSGISISWNGYFTDDFSVSPSTEYNGFNYRLSGKGKGTVKLTWDTRYVEIGPWVAQNLGATVSAGETNHLVIEIPVDSEGENGVTQYDIPFYRVAPAPADESYRRFASYGRSVYAVGSGGRPYIEFISFE